MVILNFLKAFAFVFSLFVMGDITFACFIYVFQTLVETKYCARLIVFN